MTIFLYYLTIGLILSTIAILLRKFSKKNSWKQWPIFEQIILTVSWPIWLTFLLLDRKNKN